MAWMGLDIIGSTTHELSIALEEMGLLHSANTASELAEQLEKLQHDKHRRRPKDYHQILIDLYGPDCVYAPLLQWIDSPTLQGDQHHGLDALSVENRKLKQRLAEIS